MVFGVENPIIWVLGPLGSYFLLKMKAGIEALGGTGSILSADPAIHSPMGPSPQTGFRVQGLGFRL